MRYVFVTLLSIGFLFNICLAAEKLELKDQKDKESYSLGYQFGQSLKAQGVDVNLDVYISGIKDFLDGKQPAMTQEEIRATIVRAAKKVNGCKGEGIEGDGGEESWPKSGLPGGEQEERRDQSPSQWFAVQSPYGRFWQNPKGD